MTDTETTIRTLRKMVIDTKEELTNARFHLDGLDLIFEGLSDKRTASACMTIYGTADKKLEAVDDTARRTLPAYFGTRTGTRRSRTRR